MNGDVFIRQRNSFPGYRIVAPDLKGTDAGQIFNHLLFRNKNKPLLVAWSMGVSMILSGLDSIQPRVSGFVFISGTPCLWPVRIFHRA